MTVRIIGGAILASVVCFVIVKHLENTRTLHENQMQQAFNAIEGACISKLSFDAHIRDEIVSELKLYFDSHVSYDRHDIPLVNALNGKDTWGRDLQYKRTDDGSLYVRSIGNNGIDEDGGGDDIQALIWRQLP